MATATSIQLAYEFKSTPDLILASAAGTNPNTVEIEVMISNPSLSGIAMREIMIEIPTGQDISPDISTAPSLPAPVYDTSMPWKITANGDTITVAPASGQTGTITSPIVFKLPNIQVNLTPGTVPITVTELPAVGGKVIDDTTYSLTKWPSDLAVTSFRAEPSALHDLGQYVTLYWDCTVQGKTNSFGLEAELSPMEQRHPGFVGSSASGMAATEGSLPLHDCISDGVCYTSTDGTNGVRYGPVTQTTTFVLDVVKATSAGQRSVIGQVRTTVPVLVPSISPNSTLQQSVSGQMVTLRWLAYNSAYCTVEQDDQVLVEKAPADSYDCGYVVFLPSGSGPHAFKIVAHALSGNAVAQMTFQSVATGAPVTVPMNYNIGPTVVTPDGSLALLSVYPRGQLGTAMIDLTAKRLLPTVIPNTSYIADWIRQVAVSPDSSHAFVVQMQTDNVAVIDLATKTVASATVAVRDLGSVACTPDGSLLLVGSGVSSGIVLVDLPSLQVEQTPIAVAYNPGQIAITSDGALAVVGRDNEQGNEVFLIDLGARKVVSTLTVGAGPHDVAVTSDDALALIVNGDGTVRVIDLATQTVEAQPIPTGGAVAVRSLALTPDGRSAFVALRDTLQLCLIDVPARTCAPFAPLAGTRAQYCAVSPTGSAVVVVGDYFSDTATLF